MSMIAELAVQRTIEIHPKQTTATLHLIDGVTTQSYASAYVYPIGMASGLGNQDASYSAATICLHQQTETYVPVADSWIELTDGTLWNVAHVDTNSNYIAGTALHVCACSRKA